MLKKERKCRIRVTDSINEKLDSLDFEKSTDVYKPTDEADTDDMVFLDLVGEDIYFEKSEEDLSKVNRKKKMYDIGNKFLDVFLGVSAIIGFFIFIIVLIKISL